ncbi:hypothetical protein E2562_021590 [Oryza meyeriana var. granulata]|uniref:Uncharacterized protein n=1 Tax=Oryza meyeriana var. granulata TaxID=110450 RepID=A0A6G1EXY8_9ORYZ|nr:hypothetical protein E2562_021590 [Oryza meyeriana var. granulata]
MAAALGAPPDGCSSPETTGPWDEATAPAWTPPPALHQVQVKPPQRWCGNPLHQVPATAASTVASFGRLQFHHSVIVSHLHFQRSGHPRGHI